MKEQPRTARRAFLRQAAKALAAGIGIALIPSVAQAAQMTCCRDGTCPACPGPEKRFRCLGTCPSFCTCSSNPNNCFTIPC